jgi:hypothetical protein
MFVKSCICSATDQCGPRSTVSRFVSRLYKPLVRLLGKGSGQSQDHFLTRSTQTWKIIHLQAYTVWVSKPVRVRESRHLRPRYVFDRPPHDNVKFVRISKRKTYIFAIWLNSESIINDKANNFVTYIYLSIQYTKTW